MLTSIKKLQRKRIGALIWLLCLLSSVSAQKEIDNSNARLFLKCFELPQKFLLEENYASDNAIDGHLQLQSDDIFLLGQKDNSFASILSNTEKEKEAEVTNGDDFLESWNTSGQLNWKISYIPDAEMFRIIGGKIYSLKVIDRITPEEPRRLLLKEVSKTTGLTVWQSEIKLENLEAIKLNDLALNKFANFILITESKLGNVYVLTQESGELRYIRELNQPVKSFSDYLGNYLFFAGADNNLYKATIEKDGGDLTITRLPSPVSVRGTIADLTYDSTEDTVYLTSSNNSISKLNLSNLKTEWTFQAGAAISAFSFYGDRLLAVSLDNFAYNLNRKSGKKIWKKRLPGRSLTHPLIVGESVILPIFGDSRTIILDVLKGRQTSQITLGENEYFLNSLAFSRGFLFINTSSGVKVYGRDDTCSKLLDKK